MEASVYSEAKGEYTKQLTLFIVPTFHRFFMECLQQAASEEPQAKRQLWKFQELLSQIPDWNMDRVQRETTRLIQDIQCDYLEELLTAVFIAHTKVLTAIRVGNKNKRVQITIPKLDHFIHRALSECSRLLWSSAYLFHSELSPIEKQKNHRQIEQLLHEGIAQAIRGLLPVKNILKDYLAEPDADQTEDDEADDEEEEVKKESMPIESIKEEVAVPASEPESVPEPTPESTPAPVTVEPVVTVPVATEAPVETPLPTPAVEMAAPEPVVEAPQPPPAHIEAPPPAPTPVSTPTPVTPTIIVQTEPTVKFTDFDQVIQQRGGKTHIDYVEQDRDMSEDEEIHFIGDEGEPLSDFEDLTEGPPASLDDEDFETLG